MKRIVALLSELPCLAMVLLSSTLVAEVNGDQFVRAAGSELMRNGVQFRAIGFNQPDLFSSLLSRADDGKKKSFAAIEDAGHSGIRFLRFWASGFWPCDMKLYFDDPKAYWGLMDEVFSLARKNQVMLIPSIFWQSYLWPDLCNEPRKAIADPRSKTYSAMLTYAKELVSRYKDDPNVLMWELGNEYFLAADLNASLNPTAVGAGSKSYGTRPRRSLNDSLSTEMLRMFYANMTAYIKALDSHHLVTSGDAGPRPTSRSLRESFPKNIYKEDSLRDYLMSLLGANLEPLDVMSIHYYGNLKGEFPHGVKPIFVGEFSVKSLEFLSFIARAADASQMPLFVGELGQQDPRFREDPDARFASAAIDLLDKQGADIIALWVWHFPVHTDANVTGSSYPALLMKIRDYNVRHATTVHLPRE